MKQNLKLVLVTLWNQIASLFFVLLVISAAASFILGEHTDGIIITTIITINIVLGFFQEFRASKASEKLMSLIEPTIYVFRRNELVRIKTKDLVLGDIVHLVPGSVAPVDVEVIESHSALVDDSMRTGETLPKEVGMGEFMYAGASVASGKVVARVLAIGEQSSISKYKAQLNSVKKWSSFNVFTERMIKYIFVISLVVLILAMFVLVFVLHKYSVAHYLIFAIAMLVGVVPEVLPLIISIVLTRESMLLSKNKVIVKRLSSLQSLGAIRFLLTDKTGTLTENKLKVSAVSDEDDFWEYSNQISEGEYERSPMDEAYDKALNASIGKLKTHTKHTIKNFEPYKNTTGYETFTLDDGTKLVRGLVDRVLGLCNCAADPIVKSAREYESKGMRVTALSRGTAGEWIFVGFVAFYDPLKASAASSIKTANERGVAVKILTGDTKAVAENVAEELGLINGHDSVISLEEKKVTDLLDKELMRAVVFAKCTPENKLELIDRYIHLGPVAFLGDGINDALALKRADVGIAVDNASDIAKESADIILLEKDLNPILQSVATGRRALRNILTYIIYTLSGNAGTFISLLLAAFFYPVLPMLPIQILLNNLLTDLPLMLIITDNPDDYALTHVPHFEPNKLLKRIVIFGLISSVFDFVYFQMFKDASVMQFQTGWFVLSVLDELALILSIRSSRSLFKSPAVSVPLGIGIAVSAVIPFVFVYNGTLAELFKFAKLAPSVILTLLVLLVVYMCANEVAKYFMRRRNLYNKPIPPTHVFK